MPGSWYTTKLHHSPQKGQSTNRMKSPCPYYWCPQYPGFLTESWRFGKWQKTNSLCWVIIKAQSAFGIIDIYHPLYLWLDCRCVSCHFNLSSLFLLSLPQVSQFWIPGKVFFFFFHRWILFSFLKAWQQEMLAWLENMPILSSPRFCFFSLPNQRPNVKYIISMCFSC